VSLVARITLPVSATSTITIWDGDISVAQSLVPLRPGPGGNWPLVRVINGLKALGHRIVDARKERPIDGGSEFDVERV
jgi:hypothetical protein